MEDAASNARQVKDGYMQGIGRKFVIARLTEGSVRKCFVRNIHLRPCGSIAAVGYGTAQEALSFAIEEDAALAAARLTSQRVFGAYNHAVYASRDVGPAESSMES